MKYKLLAGLLIAGFSATILSAPVQARCEDGSRCGSMRLQKTTVTHVAKAHRPLRRVAETRSRAQANPASHRHVVALIESAAPRFGVPAWFALRIAKVESGFNPQARGSHGELGVFQLKCATARGIGYRGNCSGLLDASTNVEFGLKHLSLAIRASGGDLRLAASKHNGGLGTKRIVRRYVAMVF